jgi:hypothetical protein
MQLRHLRQIYWVGSLVDHKIDVIINFQGILCNIHWVVGPWEIDFVLGDFTFTDRILLRSVVNLVASLKRKRHVFLWVN